MQQRLTWFANRPQWLDRPFPRPLCGAVTPSEIILAIRRHLRLTPMFRLLRELKKRGVNVGSLNALEMFSGTGGLYTVDYAPYVKSVEAWEIDPRIAQILRQNVPTATVKTVDSFVELDVTQNKFDLILVDPPYEMFDGHCEHFDLFPGIFRLLPASGILILSNVRLKIVMHEHYSDIHLERRRKFYGVDNPKDIMFEQMHRVYKTLGLQSGFEIKWSFLMDRICMYNFQKNSIDRTCFVVLAFQKQNSVI